MKIQHHPLFDTAKIEEHYTQKDGVEVKYVCTTDLTASDVPVDVFYRETPHPTFGNRYFGLYYDRIRDHMMITNADIVESFEFGMIVIVIPAVSVEEVIFKESSVNVPVV